MTPLLWLAASAAIAWVVAATRDSRAWPLALSLGLVVAGDVARVSCDLPARMSGWIMSLHPVPSAWCAWRLLVPARARAADAAALVASWPLAPLVAWSPSPSAWWDSLLLLSWTPAVLLELWAASSWWRAGRRASAPALAALALVAGDASALSALVAGDWDREQVAGWVLWSVTAALGCAAWRTHGRRG